MALWDPETICCGLDLEHSPVAMCKRSGPQLMMLSGHDRTIKSQSEQVGFLVLILKGFSEVRAPSFHSLLPGCCDLNSFALRGALYRCSASAQAPVDGAKQSRADTSEIRSQISLCLTEVDFLSLPSPPQRHRISHSLLWGPKRKYSKIDIISAPSQFILYQYLNGLIYRTSWANCETSK